jgi:hypothetical protein
MPEHVTHHWVRLDDTTLDLILTLDPEDVASDTASLLKAYRKWAETVREAVDDGLETA